MERINMETIIPDEIRYSYVRADQDGFDGEIVREEEAREEMLIAAIKIDLDGKEL